MTNETPFPHAPLITPGTAEWWREHAHEVPAKRLEGERALWGTIQSTAVLSDAERAEIDGTMKAIEKQLDSITPIQAAQIEDHDRLTGYRSSDNWPTWMHANTLRIHWHWCELLEAWNLNPFKRQESFGTATVDESAEVNGITRFVFPSLESAKDFADEYDLWEFTVGGIVDRNEHEFAYVTLVNNFDRALSAEFLNVVKHATNQLAIIHDERMRAIRNDSGRIGYITVTHFNQREQHEMNRISAARQKLGAQHLAE